MEYQLSMNIANRSKEDLLIILEPWAEHYTLSPNEDAKIVGIGGAEGSNFEIHHHDAFIIIDSWPGSVASVYRDGEPMEPGYQPIPE
ncbi:hypothetical protein [Labrys miyagiensis]